MRSELRVIGVIALSLGIGACADQVTTGPHAALRKSTNTSTVVFSLGGYSVGPGGKLTTAKAASMSDCGGGNALVGGGEMPIAWGIQCGNAVQLAPAPDGLYNGGSLGVEAMVNGRDTVLALISADLGEVVNFTVPVGTTLTLIAEPATHNWGFRGWSSFSVTGGITSTANPLTITVNAGAQYGGSFDYAPPAGGGGGGGGGGCGNKISC